MALVDLDYLEAAMNVTFDDAEAARAQFFIDGAEGYIEEYTGTKFSPIVGAVRRFKSDSYGHIEFYQGPVTGVTTVHDFLDNFDLVSGASYLWDGLQVISGLRTRRVYDVTYDYGYDPCPKSVQNVAVKAVMRGLSSTVSNLKALTVGDVTEEYGDMLDFSDADRMILDNYNTTESTIRLAAGVDTPLSMYETGVVLNGPDFWYDWDE